MTAHHPAHRRSVSQTSIVSLATTIATSPKALSEYIIPLFILVSIALASAFQTEVAHFLTSKGNFHQPYFTFFLTHSSFIIVFPIHLIALKAVNPSVPIKVYLDGLRNVIAGQLQQRGGLGGDTWKEVYPGFSKIVAGLTVLVSIPAIAWFAAVVWTTGLAVSTIYASSSFWVYLFSMWLLKQPLSRVTAGSIALAFLGVVVLSWAGVSDGASTEDAPNPVLGDIVMMLGAIVLGLYEVIYKMALPEGHGGVSESAKTELSTFTSLPLFQSDVGDFDDVDNDEDEEEEEEEAGHARRSSQSSGGSLDGTHPHPRRAFPASRSGTDDQANTSGFKFTLLGRQTSSAPLLSQSGREQGHGGTATRVTSRADSVRPPDLPASLHANFLTSCIGLATFVMLWVPFPLLHYFGWEPFHWPGESGGNATQIWWSLLVVALGGSIYNAGLMVLIGVWGPTTSSVANLLAIGIVAVLDTVWMGSIPSLGTMVGVGMICVGFGVLLWEGEE